MITKETLIGEIFSENPHKNEEIAEILREAGIRCFGCAAASFESLEEGLKNHGLLDAEIEAIVEKINQTLKT
jgi:hybrid cluster-associated redox disulfide protein